MWAFYGNWGSTTSPDVRVNTYCDDDLGPQTFQLSSLGYCNFHNGVAMSVGSTTVVGSLPSCFIKVGSICSPATPPVGAPVPTITVTVMNVSQTI